MAVQQWTIIKILGPSATDAISRFDRWRKARRSKELDCVSSQDWHPSTRRAVSEYLAQLAAHRYEMPVAYFSEHVDSWLASGQIARHLFDSTLAVAHNRGELWCYRLPDRGRLVRRNISIARKAQFPEVERLAIRLIEAARSYEDLWSDAAILLNRQSIGPSPGDDELIARAGKLPKWLR